MAYLIKDQAIHRSYSIPLFIREAKDDRTQYENAVAPPTVSDNLGKFIFLNLITNKKMFWHEKLVADLVQCAHHEIID